MATCSSRYSTPFVAQIAFSLSLIGRDALEMSRSPAQKVLKPPPVPEVAMVTFTGDDAAAPNCSAIASVIG